MQCSPRHIIPSYVQVRTATNDTELSQIAGSSTDNPTLSKLTGRYTLTHNYDSYIGKSAYWWPKTSVHHKMLSGGQTVRDTQEGHKIDRAFDHGHFGILILKIRQKLRELRPFKDPRGFSHLQYILPPILDYFTIQAINKLLQFY